MKLSKNRHLVTTLVATLAVASACSKEGDNNSGDGDGDSVGDGDGDTGDGDGDGDLPGDGDGDLPGDGDGDLPGDGDGDMGGAGLGGYGGEVVIEPEPVELCGTPQGMGGAVICQDVPEACGDPDDYAQGAWFDAVGRNYESGIPGDSIVFLLDGNDYVTSYDSGNCVVGGEGEDTLRMDYESGDQDVYVGGPGADTFYIVNPGGEIKIIGDFEPGEDTIRFYDESFYIPFGPSGAPDQYVNIISDFDGSDAAQSGESTRIIYDPTNGKVWWDRDGNTEDYPALHIATIYNAADITVTVDDFFDYTIN